MSAAGAMAFTGAALLLAALICAFASDVGTRTTQARCTFAGWLLFGAGISALIASAWMGALA